ncbi:AraC family transcriptional regulator [Anaerobacillus sp. MEB173]|uniref:helix-turn-helix transcriptional regulator n=1 Tax=Anaerobacillus sp. MEB173 TaxID=3383345 RepID=UPI003F8E199E
MSIFHTICERRSYSNKKDSHVHDYFQLLFPLHGCLYIGTANKEFSLTEQGLLFLPPQCEHTYYSINRNEFIVLDIPRMLFDNKPKYPTEEILLKNDENWQAIRTLLMNEAEKGASNSGLNDLMHYISRLLREHSTPPSIQYIHENYHKQMSIETLASLEHYQVNYYGQWFKEAYGVTPTKYIQSIRLEKAKQLLHNTDLSLLAIANLVGYEFQSSLTRLFQQYEQMTPQQYRLTSRKANKNEIKISLKLDK